MFDGGFLTLTLFAAMSVFGVALFTGETISINKVAVPKHLEYKGYTDVVVTHMLTDEIREMSQIAASDLEPIDVDGSSIDKSVGELESYFQLEQLLTGARDLIGSVPFYVGGEITGQSDDLTMTLRVFYKEEDRPSDVVRVSGKEEDLHQIIHDSALQALEHINPYVIALYWQRIELAEGNYAFPRTRVVIDRFLQSQPVEEHFLAYGLLGRIYMLKAEQQKDIAPEEKLADYEEAKRYLEAALLQKPDFQHGSINLGVVHAILGDYARSDAYFKAAIEIDPNDLTARKRWAEALEKQGRVREAAFQWVAAVEINRDDPSLRSELAETYLILGMIDEARVQIDEAIALDPIQGKKYQGHLQELTGTTE